MTENSRHNFKRIKAHPDSTSVFLFIFGGKKFHCKRVSGTLGAVHIQKPGSQIRRAGRVGTPEDDVIKTDSEKKFSKLKAGPCLPRPQRVDQSKNLSILLLLIFLFYSCSPTCFVNPCMILKHKQKSHLGPITS